MFRKYGGIEKTRTSDLFRVKEKYPSKRTYRNSCLCGACVTCEVPGAYGDRIQPPGGPPRLKTNKHEPSVLTVMGPVSCAAADVFGDDVLTGIVRITRESIGDFSRNRCRTRSEIGTLVISGLNAPRFSKIASPV